jgi:hypothetical protein
MRQRATQLLDGEEVKTFVLSRSWQSFLAHQLSRGTAVFGITTATSQRDMSGSRDVEDLPADMTVRWVLQLEAVLELRKGQPWTLSPDGRTSSTRTAA